MPIKHVRELIARAHLSTDGILEASELRQLGRDAAAVLRASGGELPGAPSNGLGGGAGAAQAHGRSSATARARAEIEAQLAAHAAAVAEAHEALGAGRAGRAAGMGGDLSYPGYTRRPPVPTERDLLREQQDREYEESLALDRAREESVAEASRREAAELAQIAAAEAELEAQRTRKREAAEQELSARRAELPSEPPAGTAATVEVLVRMPDGTRTKRRFAHSHLVSHLYDWVAVTWSDASGPESVPPFKLISNMPRKEHTDRELSLADAGLAERQFALFVEVLEAE